MLKVIVRLIVYLGLLLVVAAAHADALDGRVTRVADGDSLTFQSGEIRFRVRLLEIDAPEIRQAFGQQSKQSLAELCLHQRARIIWSQEDRYGRKLARVWCRGIDANAEQVTRGMAWVFDRYVTDRSLYVLQDKARVAKAGLWRDTTATPPWDWRRAKGAVEVNQTSKR